MRNIILLPILWLPVFLVPWSNVAAQGDRSELLRILPAEIPQHPRLLANDGDWSRVRRNVDSDDVSRKILAALRANAEAVLEAKPVERIVTGRRLLSVSRTALHRIMLLSSLYKITGEDRYASRAKEELLAAAAFSDWNPTHFLDTAEMAYAIAVGYDWLYDYLDDETLQTLEDALLEKAINPSFTDDYDYWVSFPNNWSQVCHAGISAAAIVLADKHPELTERVLRRAIENIPAAGAAYAPDGAFTEGPMYWSYATQFHSLFVQSLETFCGNDFGTGSLPGMEKTGAYIQDVTTPSGDYFSYGDTRMTRPFHIPMFWLAARFERPGWLEYDLAHLDRYLNDYVENSTERLMPMTLIWRRPELKVDRSEQSERGFVTYDGETPIAVFRAGSGSRALYGGIKAGSPGVSHGQMDVGSFLIEADGVRWALDLGLQEYHSIERLGLNLWDSAQESDRWKIFRLGPESHNIPRFNQSPQLVQASSEIFKRSAEGDANPFAVMDLSFIYRMQVASALRGMKLLDNKAILIQDEWTARDGQPVEYAWQMLTRAEQIEVLRDRVILKQGGERLTLFVLNEAQFQIRIEDTDNLIHSYDEPNRGVTRISIITPKAQSGALRVIFLPASAGSFSPPAFLSVQDW